MRFIFLRAALVCRAILITTLSLGRMWHQVVSLWAGNGALSSAPAFSFIDIGARHRRWSYGGDEHRLKQSTAHARRRRATPEALAQIKAQIEEFDTTEAVSDEIRELAASNGRNCCPSWRRQEKLIVFEGISAASRRQEKLIVFEGISAASGRTFKWGKVHYFDSLRLASNRNSKVVFFRSRLLLASNKCLKYLSRSIVKSAASSRSKFAVCCCWQFSAALLQ
jgi:hypothetical protein